jgi:alginate O-acetyltransferase complex protein AlgI
VFFKLPNIDHALSFFGGMFASSPIANPARIYRSLALIYALPVILQHLLPADWLGTAGQRVEPYGYGAMAALMLVEAGPETSFIYFQF